MSLEDQIIGIGQLLLISVLSMVIGLNRERMHKNAGLRTHMLTGLGACMFTILSFKAFPGSDTSRVAAAVVQGIGFLGAGVIFKRKDNVHDLTTAASIWAIAAIGMAVAARAELLAISGTIIIWFILEIMRRYSKSGRGDTDHETLSPLSPPMLDVDET